MITPLQKSAFDGRAVTGANACGIGMEARRRGFTLVEVITAMMVFSLLSLGITSSVLQTYRLSQMNILRTAAYTVAQGYMEQIMSMDPNTLESASEPWITGRPSIPTEAINALLVSNTDEVSDPLYTSPIATAPLGANMTARTDVPGDMWNVKQVMVNLTSTATSNLTTANTTPVIMTMNLDVNIRRAWSQQAGTWLLPTQPYFLISIDFQYSSNGYLSGALQSGTIRMISTNIPGRS